MLFYPKRYQIHHSRVNVVWSYQSGLVVVYHPSLLLGQYAARKPQKQEREIVVEWVPSVVWTVMQSMIREQYQHCVWFVQDLLYERGKLCIQYCYLAHRILMSLAELHLCNARGVPIIAVETI